MSLLFLCCDMGETNALIPVMEELQTRKIDFTVMAMGAAINKLESEATLKNNEEISCLKKGRFRRI